MNKPYYTGTCPNCGAKTWDGNTYDFTHCQHEFEGTNGEVDDSDVVSLPYRDREEREAADPMNLGGI